MYAGICFVLQPLECAFNIILFHAITMENTQSLISKYLCLLMRVYYCTSENCSMHL